MIYMASTKIDPVKTAGEIMELLSKHDIVHIITEYAQGQIVALSFSIPIGDEELHFKLPVRWEPVLKAMKNDRQTPNNLCTEAQARRVAWRLAMRWIEAQLALAEIGMADIREIFLPYMMMNQTTTLYEQMVDQEFPMLTKGQ